jgi:hypothetical protein
MKNINITIHPLSALIGAGIVCITMLTVGAVTAQGPSSARDVSAIEVVSDPHPRDFVWLEAGASASPVFTVPAEKIMVITGVASIGSPLGGCNIIIDGVSRGLSTGQKWETTLNGGTSMAALANSTFTFANGIPLQAGQTVQLGASADIDWLFGYLVDA